MATLVRNRVTQGMLPIPQQYGGGVLAPGDAIIIADTAVNVATALGNPSAAYVDIQNAVDGEQGAITPSNAPARNALGRVNFFENLDQPGFAFLAVTGSGAINLSMQRISVPYGISATQLDLLAMLTVAASTNFSYTLSAGIYTFSGTAAGLASSGTLAVSVASTVYTNFNSTRYRSIPLGTWNLTPGEYMVGLMASNNGPAGTTGSFSMFGASSVAIAGIEGNASNYTAYWGPGIFSAATASLPTTMGLSQINQTGAGAVAQPYFRLLASGA